VAVTPERNTEVLAAEKDGTTEIGSSSSAPAQPENVEKSPLAAGKPSPAEQLGVKAQLPTKADRTAARKMEKQLEKQKKLDEAKKIKQQKLAAAQKKKEDKAKKAKHTKPTKNIPKKKFNQDASPQLPSASSPAKLPTSSSHISSQTATAIGVPAPPPVAAAAADSPVTATAAGVPIPPTADAARLYAPAPAPAPVPAPVSIEDTPIEPWLRGINPAVAIYSTALSGYGYENMGLLMHADTAELTEALAEAGAKKPHQKVILKALLELNGGVGIS
jgi:hypothetical protein